MGVTSALTEKQQHGTTVWVDSLGNRYHDPAGTHRIYTSAGPPDGKGSYLSHTACTVCGWRPPSA